jgi:hypothetical protein
MILLRGLRMLGLLLVLVGGASAQATPAAVLYYTSSASSWVGGGESVVVSTQDNFQFFATRNFDNGVSFNINDFLTNPDPAAARYWYLDFAGASNAELTPGMYSGATRFPFQSLDAPGLSFVGNGRGDNTLSGGFRVLQAVYGKNGDVLAFAADFIQFDEGNHQWWNLGGIRYHSALGFSASASAVPEPSTTAALGAGVALIALAVRRRRRPA